MTYTKANSIDLSDLVIAPKRSSRSEIVSHFPTELKQCRKFPQRSDICFPKPKRVYKKTSLTVKSNKSSFWSYFM